MNQYRQTGVALVSAIFLLVIVASIGAFMLTIGQTQQKTTVISVLGQRSMNAAASGIEWSIQRAVQAGGAGLDCSPGTVNFIPGGSGMNGFNVAVTCNVQSFEEGTTTYNVYTLTSTATLNAFGSEDFISRSLRAVICDTCP